MARPQDLSVDVIEDAPGASTCVVPQSLTAGSPDRNNQPQAEVWIDVAGDGRLAAAAKDFRFGPTDETGYNFRVWSGLYLSDDGGTTWRNGTFQDRTPDTPLSGTTEPVYGQPGGAPLLLTHQSDPVVAFDRDGHLYTCALALDPDTESFPSAVVVSRRDPRGALVPGTTHLIGAEADARLFNDKNWIAVDRGSPTERTVVVVSLRLFSPSDLEEAPPGGYVAVSGDGARSFSGPIRLPVPAQQVGSSQFYQPLLGRDAVTGRRTLYVLFRTVATPGFALALHLLKADLEGVEGTAALAARLSDPSAWQWRPDRLVGLTATGADGYDGSFRYASYFMPALDRDSGHLYVVATVLDRTARESRVIVSRSTDAGDTWTPPAPVDDPGRGHQLMPAVAASGGRVAALWYDSRHDPEPAPPIQGLDVYYAELDAALSPRRVLRLTGETQAADRPVFTRARPAEAAARSGERPHDWTPASPAVSVSVARDCAEERYGFIGDYIGIAADARGAWMAWTDLRGVDASAGDVCAGHSCLGNRNQSIRFRHVPW